MTSSLLSNFSSLVDRLSLSSISCLSVALSIATVCGQPVLAQSSPAERTASEVWEIVRDEYLAADFSVAQWQRQRHAWVDRDYANDAMAYQAIQAAVASLDDPYTRFLTPAQFMRVQQAVGGAMASGVMLSRNQRDRLEVSAPPRLDSAAAAAGLRQGDVITAIGETRTFALDPSEAASLLKIVPGQSIALEVERDDRILTLKLAGTEAETDVTYSMRRETGRTVGYLRITQFGAKTADRVRRAISNLERAGVTAYVLDLRSNAGGRVEASTAIADMFLSGGAIATVEGRSGVLKHYEAASRTLTDKPLALLVDRGTASSSELLAAALQDRNRATTVGARTFGKGIVQSIYTLPDRSSLSVTIARYRTPEGRIVHERGLPPDEWVELSDRDRDRLSLRQDLVATSADPQYAAAVASLLGEKSDRRAMISSSSDPLQK